MPASSIRFFSQVDTFHMQIAINQSVSDLLTHPVNINNVSGASPIQKVAIEANAFSEYAQCIDLIYLYSPRANYVYSLLPATSNYFEKFNDHTWYDEFTSRDGQDYIACLQYNDIDYLTFCYNLNYPKSAPGILIIKISEQSLANLLNITNKSQEGFRLTSLTTEDILVDFCYDDSKNAVQYTTRLSNTPIELSYSSQASNLPMHFGYNLLLVAFSAVVIVILSILLSITFARKQYLSILSVITALEDPNLQSASPGTNELFYLLEKTKNIVLTNKNLENQLLEKVTNLKKAQTIALQTQINPHFLFNTLNMISYSIQEPSHTPKQSVRMLALLSNILRYSLKTEEYLVTVQEEVEMLKSYVEIVEIKHDHSFQVDWNITTDLYLMFTLKSIMQPLVENAVEHGIKKLYRKKHGRITISVYTKQDHLFINVTDNGVGMNEETRLKLENRLNSDDLFQNQNIGLNNVVSRIKLLFSDKGGFEITSDENGTSVTVYHPIITHQ